MPGTYKITELGMQVPGYSGPVVSLTNNGRPVTLVPDSSRPPSSYSYEFTLGGDRNINLAFAFRNDYRPIPPPLPPPPPPTEPPTTEPPPDEKAPQTGVNHNLAMPIVLLSLSAILFGGAEYGRRRYMKRKDK